MASSFANPALANPREVESDNGESQPTRDEAYPKITAERCDKEPDGDEQDEQYRVFQQVKPVSSSARAHKEAHSRRAE